MLQLATSVVIYTISNTITQYTTVKLSLNNSKFDLGCLARYENALWITVKLFFWHAWLDWLSVD